MCRREVFERAIRLHVGPRFQVLLDLLASRADASDRSPLQFPRAERGDGKFHALIAWEYRIRVAGKWFGHIIPVRFALFAPPVGWGWPFTSSSLSVSFDRLGVVFGAAQTVATVLADLQLSHE